MSSEAELREIALREIAEEELANENKETPTVENQEVPEVNVDPSMGVQIDVPQEFQNDETDRAIQMGATQAIPFAKDAISYGKALYQGGLQDIGERKQANLKEWEEEYKKTLEKYPVHTIGSDIAVSSLMTVGSLPYQIAGAALSSASRTETRDPSDMALNAGLGGVAVGALGLAGKAVKGVAGAVSQGKPYQYISRQLGLFKQGPVQNQLAISSKGISKGVAEHASRFSKAPTTEKAVKDFYDRASSIKRADGLPLLRPMQEYGETAAQAKNLLKQKSNELGKVTSLLDDVVTDIPVESVEQRILEKTLIQNPITEEDVLFNQKVTDKVKSYFIKQTTVKKVPTTLKKPSSVLDSKGNPLMEDVVEMVEHETVVPLKFNASNLQEHKIKAAQQLSERDWSQADSNQPFLKSFYRAVRDVADETLEAGASQLDEGSINAYRQVNMEWADLHMINKLTDTAAKTEGNIFSKGRALLDARDVLLTVPKGSSGQKKAAIAVASTLGVMSGEASATPKTQQTFERVANHIEAFPDSNYVKRILTGASVSTLSEEGDDSPFESAITSVNAELVLLDSPIKRNLADIKGKSDYILESLEYHNPTMATAFRNALYDNDDETIRATMNQASQLPEFSAIFEKGKGIDGRVYTQEEKDQLKSEVDSMDVSYIQKLKLQKELQLNGTIPQVEEEPERFFRYNKRDKSKPNY